MVSLFDYAAKKWGQKAPKGPQADIDAWAEENDLAPLPQSGRLHNLAGLYVPKNIARDLTEMTRLPTTAQRFYLAYLGAWKSSKTIYNPSTHARNVMGNFVFSYIAGVSIHNPANANYYIGSAKSLYAKDTNYHDLVKLGVLGTEYYGVELRRIENKLRLAKEGRVDEALAGLRTVHATVGSIYAAEDQVFKMAAFLKYRADGMSKASAAREVNKWFPNYERIGQLTRWLRQSPIGAPFISFIDQSVRIAGRAAKEHPIRLAIIAALPGIITAISAIINAMSPEEKALVDEERSYFEPILPYRDTKGRVQTIDLRYIMPLANDILPEERGGNVWVPWIFSSPIVKGVTEQFYGEDSFTGREFIREGMTSKEKALARLGQGAKSIIPYPSGAYWGPRRVYRSAKKTSEEAISNAVIGSLIGINIRSPYVAERHIKTIARNMLETGDRKQAANLLGLWNETYKPKRLPNLTLETISRGAAQSKAAIRRRGVEEAAEAMLRGDRSEAKNLVRRHNEAAKTEEGHITLADVNKEVGILRKRGAGANIVLPELQRTDEIYFIRQDLKAIYEAGAEAGEKWSAEGEKAKITEILGRAKGVGFDTKKKQGDLHKSAVSSVWLAAGRDFVAAIKEGNAEKAGKVVPRLKVMATAIREFEFTETPLPAARLRNSIEERAKKGTLTREQYALAKKILKEQGFVVLR